MDWNDDVIQRLKTLWADGHSTAEIGRRLGVSKNAVVGKAHRLTLTARPSPIKRAPDGDGAKKVVPSRRVVGPTLEPIGAAAPPVVPPPQPAPPPPPPMLRSVSRPSSRRTVNCCWPIGEPGTRSFRFCDADSMQNKPYCAAHASLAYVKVRDRREDAA